MLQPALADDAQEHQFARVHVRVAVVRLQRILRRVIGVHVVGHGAAVHEEIRRVVRLGGDDHAAGGIGAAQVLLCLRFVVDADVHLGELEQVLAVVAGFRVVVGGGGKAEVGVAVGKRGGRGQGVREAGVRQPLSRGRARTLRDVRRWHGTRQRGQAAARHVGRQHDESAIQPHLHLQVALSAAVVRVRPGRVGDERVGDAAAGTGLLRQDAGGSAGRRHAEPRKQDRCAARGGRQAVVQRHRHGVALVDHQGRSGQLHLAGRTPRIGDRRGHEAARRRVAAIPPGVDRGTVRLRGVAVLGDEVERGTGDAGGRRERRAGQQRRRRDGRDAPQLHQDSMEVSHVPLPTCTAWSGD